MTAVLPWFERASTLPMMPGGITDQFPNLTNLLRAIVAVDGDLDVDVRWPDEAAEPRSLRDVVQRMGRCGLIERRSRNRVSLTEAATSWLEKQDPLVVIQAFHNNMQFVGELLLELDNASSPLTHDGIRAVARDVYGLPWNSLDPGRRRTTWLRAAGLVELSFDNTLNLTLAGRSFLQTLTLVDPSDLIPSGDVEIDRSLAPSVETSSLLNSFDPDDREARKASIGQIPRPAGINVIESLRILVNESSPHVSREHLFQTIASTFEVVEKSAPRVISMMVNNGLLTQIAATQYRPTPAALAWLESGDDLEVVRILHVHVQFVGELLDAVEVHDKAPALSDYASAAYGFRPDVNGVRTRLHLLLHAGLLYESGWGRFALTPLGISFRETLPRALNLQPQDDSPQPDDVKVVQRIANPAAELLAQRVVEAAKEADHPHNFEVVVRDAFRYLGFEAEGLGGSGKTDVLLTFRAGPGVFTTVVVDTKSASSGTVEEKVINFDTINEHRKHHEANFACIVGPSFHQSRLPARARDRGVTLLDASLLAEAVRRQESTALGTQQLARIFDPTASPAKVLEGEWARADRSNTLFSQAIAALSREAQEDDQVTHGALSLDNLYFLLRSDLESKPDPVALEQAVKFLCSPLVDCVSTTGKGQYVATEQPATIARKLRSLALAAQMAADSMESI